MAAVADYWSIVTLRCQLINHGPPTPNATMQSVADRTRLIRSFRRAHARINRNLALYARKTMRTIFDIVKARRPTSDPSILRKTRTNEINSLSDADNPPYMAPTRHRATARYRCFQTAASLILYSDADWYLDKRQWEIKYGILFSTC
jgi:hypothetical protein